MPNLSCSDEGMSNEGNVKPVRTDRQNFYPGTEATDSAS